MLACNVIRVESLLLLTLCIFVSQVIILIKNGYYFSYQHLFKISQFSSEEIKTEQIYHFIEREAN